MSSAVASEDTASDEPSTITTEMYVGDIHAAQAAKAGNRVVVQGD